MMTVDNKTNNLEKLVRVFQVITSLVILPVMGWCIYINQEVRSLRIDLAIVQENVRVTSMNRENQFREIRDSIKSMESTLKENAIEMRTQVLDLQKNLINHMKESRL